MGPNPPVLALGRVGKGAGRGKRRERERETRGVQCAVCGSKLHIQMTGKKRHRQARHAMFAFSLLSLLLSLLQHNGIKATHTTSLSHASLHTASLYTTSPPQIIINTTYHCQSITPNGIREGGISILPIFFTCKNTNKKKAFQNNKGVNLE